MTKYILVNEFDPNNRLELMADNDGYAATEALAELGYYIVIEEDDDDTDDD